MGQITEERSAPLMASVSGVRGIVGASLTPEVVCRFAGALASWLREQPEARPVIVVGRDGREGGEVAAQIAVGALRAAGMRVVDLGVAMTATVGVMVKRHRAAGGLVLTASHNPAEWNGLKPITGLGSAPAPDQASAILQRFHDARAEWASHATLGELDCDAAAAHAHVAAVLERIEPVVPVAEIASRRFRVALDSVNASGSLAGPMLLEALGCRVERVACDGSGVFPHTPEPTAANLVSLCEATRGADVDVAFAQDPDADRLAIVDETAAYLGEEYTLALAAQAILPGHEAAVLAANLSTSRMIDDVAARFAARVVRTPVGEANVVAGMREHQAALGGEGNGGVIWPDVVEIRDSLGAMALVLALMTREGRPLSAIAADLPSYAIVKRKAPIREGLAEHAYRNLKERFAGATFDEQDGLRLDFDDPPSWIHVRPSNTEPILRVIAEAPSRAAAEKLASEAEDIVASL
jgi:phosphomannomutase